MTTPVLSSIVTALGLTLASAAASVAQPQQPQPPAPAETTAPATPRATSNLDLGIDLFGAVDEALGSTDDSSSGSRTYWGGNSTLSFERGTRAHIFGASGSASYRRFSEVSDLAPSYSGSMRLSGRMTRRTRYDLTQTVSYGPSNALSLFGVGELSIGSEYVPTIDYRLLDSNQFGSISRGGVSYNVSRRGTLAGGVSFDYSQAPDLSSAIAADPANPIDPSGPASEDTFKRWGVFGRYTNQFSRYMNWYAGYGMTNNTALEGDTTAFPRAHSIDVGLAYSRPLAFSRRTQVRGQFGSQIIQSSGGASREWRAAGTAGLQHEVGRTWRLQALYLRDARYVPLFTEPALTDAISTSITGNVSRQSTLGLVANYSTGSIGVDTGANGFHGSSASATYRYAFLRGFGLYAEYFVFDFDFENGIALADAVTTGTRRHGLRFGVTMGTGLWGNRRRSPLTLDGDTAQ